MKRLIILFYIALFLGVYFGLFGCTPMDDKLTNIVSPADTETGVKTDAKGEGIIQKQGLVTKEYLLENGYITEEDIDGIDVNAFIEYYDLTKSDLKDYNIKKFIEMYKDIQSAPPQISYQYMFNAPKAGLNKDYVGEIQRLAWYLNEGTSVESMVVDFESGTLYYGEGDIIDHCEYVDVTKVSLKAEDRTGLVAIIRSTDILTWDANQPDEDFGDSTQNANWSLAFEMEDGRIANYGMIGSAYTGFHEIRNYLLGIVKDRLYKQ